MTNKGQTVCYVLSSTISSMLVSPHQECCHVAASVEPLADYYVSPGRCVLEKLIQGGEVSQGRDENLLRHGNGGFKLPFQVGVHVELQTQRWGKTTFWGFSPSR